MWSAQPTRMPEPSLRVTRLDQLCSRTLLRPSRQAIPARSPSNGRSSSASEVLRARATGNGLSAGCFKGSCPALEATGAESQQAETKSSSHDEKQNSEIRIQKPE